MNLATVYQKVINIVPKLLDCSLKGTVSRDFELQFFFTEKVLGLYIRGCFVTSPNERWSGGEEY